MDFPQFHVINHNEIWPLITAVASFPGNLVLQSINYLSPGLAGALGLAAPLAGEGAFYHGVAWAISTLFWLLGGAALRASYKYAK